MYPMWYNNYVKRRWKKKIKTKGGVKSEKAKEGYKKSLRDNLNINSTVPSSGRDNKDIQLRLQRGSKIPQPLNIIISQKRWKEKIL